MTSSNHRIDRVEALLERFIDASVADRQASSEHRQASNERMTRIEQGLERVEQIVESNNRFLESFSADLRRYTDTMNNLATRIDGVIATSNQDRQEANTRLGAIQRQVSAIAKHLGVT